MPFKLNIRRMNAKTLPQVEKKIKKLFEEKIIVALRFSWWVANLVTVKKKNKEIRICIDLKNLNRVFKISLSSFIRWTTFCRG